MNSVINLDKLMTHKGHDIVIVEYGEAGNPENIALECETCNEVLADADVE